MTERKNKYGEDNIRIRRFVSSFILFLLISISCMAQEPPPRPLEVNTTAQELSFGSFTVTGAGGEVIVYADGSRGSTGNVVLLNMSPVHSTTRLELVANPGTVVSLLAWPSSTLSDGSNTMTFNVDSSFPVLPLVITTTPPSATSLDLGATLTVGNLLLNPAGYYSGTYNITFFQE
ncbi:MAG TPA: DUF4402 domain-containing protein [Bacteroidales bacterium]|nr:DUF4402 domain-containing protein [Bacteroidales bacterium]HPF02584.1 DUF4402 domain-containing protein [Bacteroidales bacterium]HPJ58876.1 DUF4402 domain-containing protein [Bacteroidales bacterium]HPR11031.1 DUF4402 domain-containing protein [Bacteroidales bacterium]HRW84442.1 DUF4402 domain-containing protein [Bacteroidales bacterium]